MKSLAVHQAMGSLSRRMNVKFVTVGVYPPFLVSYVFLPLEN